MVVGRVNRDSFLSARPWFPTATPIVTTTYTRINMFASGKFFLASAMPAYLLPFYIWNPLFHAIDQARGFTFINYNAHVTNLTYPLYFTFVVLFIGMMLDFLTRKSVSISWSAGR